MKYKVDDSVLCISKATYILRGTVSYPITINKYYVIIKEDNNLCYIINDNGGRSSYKGEYFKNKSEVREIKINKILGI
jgi:hypothetical protein